MNESGNPKIRLEDWALLNRTGLLIKSARDLYEATPEYKHFLDLVRLQSETQAIMGIPASGVEDYTGDIEVVMRRSDEELAWIEQHRKERPEPSPPVAHEQTSEAREQAEIVANLREAEANASKTPEQ